MRGAGRRRTTPGGAIPCPVRLPEENWWRNWGDGAGFPSTVWRPWLHPGLSAGALRRTLPQGVPRGLGGDIDELIAALADGGREDDEEACGL